MSDQPPPSPFGGSPGHPSQMDAGARRRGPRWGALTAVGCSVAVLSSVFAFGLSRDASVRRPVNIGRPAPDFAVRTLDGSQPVRLSALRGQVVVLNFWSSWCAGCVVEHPALARIWERFRDHGVVVLGMDFNDAGAAATSFASRLGITYPLLTDPSDRAALAYGVTGPPETFLIGPDGVIEGRTIGPIAYADLAREIQSLLAKAAA